MLKNNNIKFDPLVHSYTYEGQPLKGITGMIKNRLFPDMYADIPEYILEKAAEEGTRVHDALHTFDVFGSSDDPVTVPYRDVIKKAGIEVIENEYLTGDLTHFATAIDKVALQGGKVVLIDVKNTSKINMQYLSWQLSICKYFFELNNPELKVAKLYAYWTKDRKGVHLYEVDEINRAEVLRLLDAERLGLEYDPPIDTTICRDDSTEALQLVQELTRFINLEKEVKREQEALKKKLNTMFAELNVQRWETDYFTIAKRADYERTTIDVKQLEEDYPEIAVKYKRTTLVAGGITTKLK